MKRPNIVMSDDLKNGHLNAWAIIAVSSFPGSHLLARNLINISDCVFTDDSFRARTSGCPLTVRSVVSSVRRRRQLCPESRHSLAPDEPTQRANMRHALSIG